MRGGVQYGGAAAGEELNLGMIGRAIWRHKLLIILPTLLVAALAFIGASMLTPRYKSEARVLIEGRENIFLRPEAEKSMTDRSTVDPETVTSQVQLILSRDLARDVIKELNLTDSPEFNAALRESSPLSLLRTIGILKDPMSMSPEERVLTAYYDRLTAYAIDKSRVIVIEFQSADPDLAARAANLIAKRYLSFQQVARQEQTRSAGQWLSGELEKLRQKVTEAEAKVEDFRAKSNLYVGSNNTSLVNQQLTELSSQVSAARAQKADAEARARSIRDALRSGQSLDSADVATSELIRRLSEQRVTLKSQLAEQSSTLLPQHPRIKEMRAQIADLEHQIRAEGDRIARALEREAKVSGSRLEALTANLDQFKRQTASTSDQDVQLRALEREAKAQRDLFESYLAKYRETTARDSIAAAPADARIISTAVVSNIPYFPKKVPITLIAALGTFCLSMAFVVTAALLNSDNYRAARRKADVEPEFAPAERPIDARTRAEDFSPVAAEVFDPKTSPATPASMAHISRAEVDVRLPVSTESELTAPPLEPVSAASVAHTVLDEDTPIAPRTSTGETPVDTVSTGHVDDSRVDEPASVSPTPSTSDSPIASAVASKVADTTATEANAGSGIDEQTTVSPKWSLSDAPVTPVAATMVTDTNLDKIPPKPAIGDMAPVVPSAAPELPSPESPPLAPASVPHTASTKIDDVIAAMHRAGNAGQRVAVIGSARYVGTTLTAIALARALARNARVVLVDLAFASANADESTEEPESRGIADLVRGEASFSDIIIRDPGSRAHLVTVGRVKNDVQALLNSQVLWDGVYALAQGYDYLVIDAGAQADTAPHLVAAAAPYAVLVCGDAPVAAISGQAGQLQRAGFAHVAIMSGPPPALEEATAQSAA
jgi:uncharacterized protein involved in exopolysaccharide biosynthesis/Mrp family chromosome partitioning ATPase